MRLRPCTEKSCSTAGTHCQLCGPHRTPARGSKAQRKWSTAQWGNLLGECVNGLEPLHSMASWVVWEGCWVSLGVVHKKPHPTENQHIGNRKKETPSPSMALQGPFNSVPLLTKPNMKPAGKGEMLTESRSHVSKQGKEKQIWRWKAINGDLAQRGEGRAG